jgi:S1-C subfamily serine protease
MGHNVRHRFAVVALSLLLNLAAVPAIYAQQGTPDWRPVVKKVQTSVVLGVALDADGDPEGFGTGFFISSSGEVITNHHVLEGAAGAVVKTPDNQVYPIESVLADDRQKDLIRVKVKMKESAKSPPLTLGSDLPDVGERILVIGNPEGLEQTVSEGIVSAVRDLRGFGKVIQISAPISSGSSGSPVFNHKGEVVGVATFQMVEGQNLNFAVAAQSVVRLARGAEKSFAAWAGGNKGESEPFRRAEALIQAKEYEKAIPFLVEALKKTLRTWRGSACWDSACSNWRSMSWRSSPTKKSSASSPSIPKRISIWACATSS